MRCSFALQSPTPSLSGAGAIAILQLRHDVSGGLERLGIKPVDVGRAVVRDWPSVDQVVVARFSSEAALVFPHGGTANVARVLRALESAGLSRELAAEPADAFPEARSPVEARLLHALSRAESTLAIDLLLDQPRRWVIADADHSMRMDDASSRVLKRLIEPPLVVAIGAPNIGKSSLLNALAGRSVAIVADQPGTTRDHVGAMLDMAGLVIRYVDTPGIQADHDQADPILAEAVSLGLRMAAAADLVLLCADSGSAYSLPPNPALPSVRVGLRSDLGPPAAGSDIAVSARSGSGLDNLVAAVRDRLVRPALLMDNRAWTFW